MNGGMSTLSATGVQVLFAGTVSRKAHRIQSLDNFRKCYPLSISSRLTFLPFFFLTFKKKKIIDEVTSCNLLEDNCKSRIVILQFYFFKILSSEIIHLTDTLD